MNEERWVRERSLSIVGKSPNQAARIRELVTRSGVDLGPL
jgi:hypothetical protein